MKNDAAISTARRLRADGMSVADIAKALEVSDRTITRWTRKEPKTTADPAGAAIGGEIGKAMMHEFGTTDPAKAYRIYCERRNFVGLRGAMLKARVMDWEYPFRGRVLAADQMCAWIRPETLIALVGFAHKLKCRIAAAIKDGRIWILIVR